MSLLINWKHNSLGKKGRFKPTVNTANILPIKCIGAAMDRNGLPQEFSLLPLWSIRRMGAQVLEAGALGRRSTLHKGFRVQPLGQNPSRFIRGKREPDRHVYTCRLPASHLGDTRIKAVTICVASTSHFQKHEPPWTFFLYNSPKL